MYQITIPDSFIRDFNEQYPKAETEQFIPKFLNKPEYAEIKKTVVSHLEMSGLLRIIYFDNRTAYDLVKKRVSTIQENGTSSEKRDISQIEYAKIVSELETSVCSHIKELLNDFKQFDSPSIEEKDKLGNVQTISELAVLEQKAQAYLIEYHRQRRIEISRAWMHYCNENSKFVFVTTKTDY